MTLLIKCFWKQFIKYRSPPFNMETRIILDAVECLKTVQPDWSKIVLKVPVNVSLSGAILTKCLNFKLAELPLEIASAINRGIGLIQAEQASWLVRKAIIAPMPAIEMVVDESGLCCINETPTYFRLNLELCGDDDRALIGNINRLTASNPEMQDAITELFSWVKTLNLA